MNTTKITRLSLALVATLLISGVARANVIYTIGLTLTVTTGHSLGLMIESNTYAFRTDEYDNFNTDSDLIIRTYGQGGDTTDFIEGDKGSFSEASLQSNNNAVKYEYLQQIGPSASSFTWGYLNDSWADGDHGYAGIVKHSDVSKTYQYGWVDIGRSYDNEVQGSVYTVYGWAWDTTLNETINAGTFVGNGDGISVGVVPEPSSFAMLGIGGLLVGGYAWRKKKQTV